jgi:hypothetical protein
MRYYDTVEALDRIAPSGMVSYVSSQDAFPSALFHQPIAGKKWKAESPLEYLEAFSNWY